MNTVSLRLPDYRYHIECRGQKTSPPLLFLHGFMGSCHDFSPLIEQLESQFYCVGLDLPGHGQTQVLGNEECYQMDAIASSLIQVLDQLNLSPCHLLGYSMGGRLALYLALHYPNAFQTVILESTSPGLQTAQERVQRLQQDHAIARRLETEKLESIVDWWYDQPLFKSLKDDPSFEPMLHRRRQNNPDELARSLRQISTGKQPSLWEKIPSLDLPCLWVVGEQDKKFMSLGLQIHLLNPGIQLQPLVSTGHNIHLESPNAFAQVIRQFIRPPFSP